ncbi:MAG: ERF family protein [Treponema sp.]|jgi:hypothetical protein|nr:ERF family protein [Treponema sp.]
MNIYEKVIEARLEFQKAGIKMSGENSYAKYQYYELSDILPAINAIAGKLKFLCVVSFNEHAELTIINTEKPDETIQFMSPMSTAALKGCHEVQNLGAVQTYLKRYLYQNAFEIVESDALDAKTSGKSPERTEPKDPRLERKETIDKIVNPIKGAPFTDQERDAFKGSYQELSTGDLLASLEYYRDLKQERNKPDEIPVF